MAATYVIFYAERGMCPFLSRVEGQQEKVQDKIFDAITRLEELGYELRRPEAEYLRDDIYELRIKKGHVNYRPLYFFDDLKDPKTDRIVRQAVIVHGCAKEARVDPRDINLAVARRGRYLMDRTAHTFRPPGSARGDR